MFLCSKWNFKAKLRNRKIKRRMVGKSVSSGKESSKVRITSSRQKALVGISIDFVKKKIEKSAGKRIIFFDLIHVSEIS